jgi:short-subunit dehydrogenase
MQLSGRVAIVTGAGRGIGAATTRALVERGVSVVALGDDAAVLDRTCAETGAVPYVADVRDPTHADGVVRDALERFGRLDIVVANAGVGHAGDFAAMNPSRIVDLVTINALAPMLIARAALPTMLRQDSGSLVFVTSVAGALLVPRETVYSASKAAVEAFAEPLREELRGTGIAVTTVLPGVVATAFFAERGEPYARRFPRPQPPERLAGSILRAIERGEERAVTPPWFRFPIRVRGAAPRLYRALARRFG